MISLRKHTKGKKPLICPLKLKTGSIVSPIHNIRTGVNNPFGFMLYTHDIAPHDLHKVATPLELSQTLRHDIELLTDQGKHTEFAAEIIRRHKDKDFRNWLSEQLAHHNIQIVTI